MANRLNSLCIQALSHIYPLGMRNNQYLSFSSGNLQFIFTIPTKSDMMRSNTYSSITGLGYAIYLKRNNHGN